MHLTPLSPRKSLNKAYLKVKPSRSEIELFKKNLIGLLDGLDESESEEHNKNDLVAFLKNTFYQKFYINTKGRNDLVIHNGMDSKSFAGVLVEAKKPSNKTEMVRPDNLNAKAFQELILYYLRERITNHNLEIKHLVATNINEWYVFDASLFEKIFAQNKTLVKQFTDFEEGRLAGKTTDFFYKEVAEPFMAGLTAEICFTVFDFREYDKPLRNDDKKDDSKLIALYKLLSPEHLLMLPFTNDSNSLDKAFYTELLHIIGLTETKEGSKKLIGRKKDGQRDPGSLIENAIIQINSRDMISRIDKPSRFGETHQERLFNVSLDLVITWIDRILFLKLLEAQLIKYHKDDSSYSFLTSDKMKGYDALDSLFFRVLAKKTKERDPAVTKLFEKVPYLNSSLFEPTELERETIFISNLQDDCMIPFHPGTVLKNNTGKRLTGTLNGLDYLFAFLDAYDFSGEGAEEIQEDNKTLINASVLGLIFEKINGYKDGSFFTPGFITMYMCHETIRRSVVQKFNEAKDWDCKDINQLYDKIEDRSEANSIINSLKICDPAVGSGHFLVSALNEIIAIKSELKILSDKDGKRLKEYHVEVANDELIITDEDGVLFEYNPNSPESQRVQETIFHEKQTIIENCLFGVDINPNSIKICRLRLWIELLKNAYYKSADESTSSSTHQLVSSSTELETLPNIDINIKCGNSLVSRFALDADIKQALKKSKWNIFSYRLAVMSYRNAENKEQKRTMEELIAKIKNDFHTEFSMNNPLIRKRDKLLYELYHRFTGNFLFEAGTDYGNNQAKDKGKEEQTKLENEISIMTNKIEEYENNKIFENAFEWRFEFPEVLNDEGDFVGFDVVIGNPPYGIKEKGKKYLDFVVSDYPIARKVPDSYFLFMIKANELLKTQGLLSLIVPNTFCDVEQGVDFRQWLLTKNELLKIYDSSWVFEDAVVDTLIYFQKKSSEGYENVLIVNKAWEEFTIPIKSFLENEKNKIDFRSDYSIKEILFKIRGGSVQLHEIADVRAGIILYEKGKGIPLQDETTLTEKPFTQKFERKEGWRPLIRGGDIDRYSLKTINEYVNYGEWLAAPRDPNLFLNKRIIIRRTDDVLRATIISDDSICVKSCHIVKTKDPSLLLFLLSLINSKLFKWNYQSTNSQMVGKIFAEIKITYIEQLPVKVPAQEQRQLFEMLVDQILSIKESNPSADTSTLEKEIDQLVYELYGLTEEEIKIVEES